MMLLSTSLNEPPTQPPLAIGKEAVPQPQLFDGGGGGAGT